MVHIRTWFVAIVALGLVAGTYAQTPTTLPTAEGVAGLFDAGKYQEALRDVSRLLALSGRAAEGLNRYALLCLRGECQLNLHQGSAAIDAFAQARKEAKSLQDAAVANATEQLIKRSVALVYTTKPKDKADPPKKFEVLDRTQRKAAFSAMFEEDFPTLTPKVQTALKATSVSAMLTLGPTVTSLRALELAATGQDTRTREAVQPLGKRARELMEPALATMDRQIAQIEIDAAQWVTRTVSDPANPKAPPHQEQARRGLDSAACRTLDDAIATSQRIPTAAKELCDVLLADPKDFGSLVATANRVLAHATAVRTTDYGQGPQTISIH